MPKNLTPVDIVSALTSMTSEQRLEIFNQIQEYFCFNCGEPVSGWCRACRDADFND